MQMIGDVKCYHCGHVSGQVEGTRGQRLVLHTFKPRPDYRGAIPGSGERLRCERCQGPVYVEDLRAVAPQAAPAGMPVVDPKDTPSRGKAA